MDNEFRKAHETKTNIPQLNKLLVTKMSNLKSHWVDELGTFRALFKFDNNYGASVISGPYSYGGPKLFELAVIYWHDDKDFSLCYTTPITDDVLGYLTVDKVKETLEKIQQLNKDNCYYDWNKPESEE